MLSWNKQSNKQTTKKIEYSKFLCVCVRVSFFLIDHKCLNKLNIYIFQFVFGGEKYLTLKSGVHWCVRILVGCLIVCIWKSYATNVEIHQQDNNVYRADSHSMRVKIYVIIYIFIQFFLIFN